MPGRFITFEGIDGAGKSTQLGLALEWARARGLDHLATREPGGTPAGEAIRTMLLEAARAIHPETELLLMFAARNEHLEGVIRPALAGGRWVFCDRFTDASYAYQGGGRGLAPERIAALETWVQHGLQPDLTLLFDVDPGVGRSRRAERAGPVDRFEAQGDGFQRRVREAYLERAARSGGRIVVVNAVQPAESVWLEVERQLEKLRA